MVPVRRRRKRPEDSLGLVIEGVKKDFRAKQGSIDGSFCRVVTRMVGRPKKQPLKQVPTTTTSAFKEYSAWEHEDPDFL